MEQLRTRRIRKEQEYIEQMSKAVEDHLRNTKEEQRYNEEFERLIRKDVYQMHGISEDKLQGMTEYRYALYRGTAFGMFFLSLILTESVDISMVSARNYVFSWLFIQPSRERC